MSDPANYTIGWICALEVEYVAAQEFLDEEDEEPRLRSPNDTNDYAFGKIGEHHVVIAILPDGEYGTAPAASVATNMLNSFPNVRLGLMVGIGGGVPSAKHDIRLGDVVVSAPRDREGGVFQYDFGKTIQGQGFQYTRFLNQPPISLRTAITGIQAQYKRKGHRLKESIDGILQKNTRLRQEYARPPLNTDRLFKTEIAHDARGCAIFCADDLSKLVHRHKRSEHADNPTIHYGLIASADQLMKDALIRDKLAAEKNVLCFEMEAAGLMNHFPCLVIRGICDYSDSHKNKEWQGYASMVAAAYAKDLLLRIHPSRVEAEKRIGDVLSSLQDVAEEHRNIAQKQLVIQQDIVKRNWSDKQEECLQLFRLTSGTKDATYEWYKNHVEARVEGTCEWFLNHDNFQRWLEEDSGPLLVSADPGCGKSVLAKYLIDDRLPRSSTICYFFFKDKDQCTVRQALCALLHQLFSQRPFLIKHAMEEYRKNGRGMIKSTNSLWAILGQVVKDPDTGPVIIVLDALDECAQSEFEDLIWIIEGQFQNNHSGFSKLKYLLTSRPYEQIVCKFTGLLKSFPYVRIPGEEESESISREVNHVIRYRVEQLAREKRLSDPVKCHLREKLLKTPHRTYLWVYLVFDLLAIENFKKTPNGIDYTIAALPTNIYEAYERILSKSKKDPMVRRALSIILAANRPLTLSEMNIALNVHKTSRSIRDLDVEDDEDFRSRLRTWCGLFVSVHHDKVYFLHQTAREFLLAHAETPSIVNLESRWRHSISSQSAHNVLTEICVVYLDFLNDLDEPLPEFDREGFSNLEMLGFLDYSAQNWGIHFRKACISADADVLPFALRICDAGSRSRAAWFAIYWMRKYFWFTNGFTSLMVSSYFGLEAVVTAHLEKGEDLESRDGYGRTALSWAVINGHASIAKLLLEKGADLDSKDNDGQSTLLFATQKGYEKLADLLLEKGAGLESKDNRGLTPLLWAARNGHENVVKLLLEKGADFNSKDINHWTPLLWATEDGHKGIIKLLLEKGADFDSKDNQGQSTLSCAAKMGHESITKMLLEKGADFNSEDDDYWTPLLWAAEDGHKGVIKLLLEKGADFDSKYNDGQSTLFFVTQKGYDNIIEVLLEKGAKLNLKDNQNQGLTPPSWAVKDGHVFIIKALLESGSKPYLEDIKDWKFDFEGQNRNDVRSDVTLQQALWEKEEEEAYLALGLSDLSDDRAFAYELVFKEGQIMAGSFRALVERLTAYKSTPDATFVSTFYLTFRLFVTPLEFAGALAKRFDYIRKSPEAAEPVRLHIYNVLKSWLETYWCHETDNSALDFIVHFLKGDFMHELHAAAGHLLRLAEKVSTVQSRVVPRPVSSIGKTDTVPLSAPVIAQKMLSLLNPWHSSRASTTILDFDPLEVARQLTTKGSRIFCSILPEELIDTEWVRKSSSWAVNVRAMLTFSADLARLVARSISFDEPPKTPKKQASAIKHWVKIADKCLELNNYDSLVAITGALGLSTISRVAWDVVSRKTTKTLEHLGRIVDRPGDYTMLRRIQQDQHLPCLPFIGIYLVDLYSVEHGNRSLRFLWNEDEGPPLINFEKHLKTTRIIRDLQRFQMPYHLPEIPELQNWIENELARCAQRRDNCRPFVDSRAFRQAWLGGGKLQDGEVS